MSIANIPQIVTTLVTSVTITKLIKLCWATAGRD